MQPSDVCPHACACRLMQSATSRIHAIRPATTRTTTILVSVCCQQGAPVTRSSLPCQNLLLSHAPRPAHVSGNKLTKPRTTALIELAAPVVGMEGKFALVNGLNGSVGDIVEDREMLLAGFGSMRADGGGGRSRVLMEVGVKSVGKEECIDANPFSHSRDYINFDHVVCTGGEPGKDSCNGDSGGPAIIMHGGQPWLVGVLSKGSQKPGK